MRTIDIYKRNLISEIRICKYCGTNFAIEKYYPYISCPNCRKKEEYESLAKITKCIDCGNMFTSKFAGYKRCPSCSAALRTTLNKTSCSKCGKAIYDTQDDGLCTICRRDAARKLAKSTCKICGKPAKSRRPFCAECDKLEKLKACAKPCVICGSIFTPKSLTCKNTPYCSEKCRKIGAARISETKKSKIGTAEQLSEKFRETLKRNPTASNIRIAKLIGVSISTLLSRGVPLQDIRNELGLHVANKTCHISKFELKIKSILLTVFTGYNVIWQKTFSDLKDKNYLRYDFYIEELNLLVEADGHQHVYNHYHAYDDPTKHDIMKNEYAKKKNINLLRIHYFASAKKENELKNLLNTLRCIYQETGKLNLFNCWNGGDKLLQISNQGMCATYKAQRPSSNGVGASAPKWETP